MKTYHDITVIVDGKKYRPANDHTLEITMMSSAGWRLWRIGFSGNKSLIGGEFDSEDFRIYCDDILICGEEN